MDTIEEIFVELPGYHNYVISNHGRIKAISRKILTPEGHIRILKEKYRKYRLSKDGSYRLGLTDDNGNEKYFFVHRLVAMAFIENPQNKEYVFHLDGNNKNNMWYNLKWANFDELQQVAHLSASLSGKTKSLNNHFSRPCTQLLDGVAIGTFPSISEAGRVHNLNPASIHHVITGRDNQCGGFQWKYS